jgi:peptidase MA superfamily protein
MGAMTVRPPAALGRSIVVLLIVGLVSTATATRVAAATWVDFGAPTVASSFASGVTFNQPVTLSEPAGRVELLVTQASALGPEVIEVPKPPGAGSTTLTDALARADDFLLPNTKLTARWRVTAANDPSKVALGPPITTTFVDDRFDWKTQAGDLVTVHWVQGSNAFGERALRIAQQAIADSSKLLGVSEKEPIDFFIYADENAFRDAIGPGVRENVGGLAIPEIRTLFGLITEGQIDDPWVGIVIPHELTHIVFDTASKNPYHEPPHWLNEGLAVYVSEGYDAGFRSDIKDAIGSGTLMPLDGLTGQFPTDATGFTLGYAESVGAVDYLVRTYGKDALVKLIRSYADGRTDDEAFKAALGVDAEAFSDGWLKDVNPGGQPPTRYGPQPAAPGPVPAGWTGTTGAGGPAASPVGGIGAAAPSAIASTPTSAGAVGGSGQASGLDIEAWVVPFVAVIALVIVIVAAVTARTSRRRDVGS